jgi:uncharacterized protein
MTADGVVRVGLISDTHGMMRPQALKALAGSDLILHAGDVGGQHVLDALSAIAPVHAVRGNTDDPFDPNLDGRLHMAVGALSVHVSHGHELGSPTPGKLVEAYKADVIVYGHTHKALVTRLGSTLVVNPGAAGAARFGGAVSLARLTVRAGTAEAEIVTLVE